MENWFRYLLLSALSALHLIVLAPNAYAQSSGTVGENVLIQPEIKRTNFDESLISAKDIELSIALGYLSLEDFGNNSLTVFGINYSINEKMFVQLDYGLSEGGQTSYEILSGGAAILTNSERELSFYRINLAYNVLPGEAFLNENISYNSAFFISAGIGNTEFAGNDRFSINYGAGYKVLLSDELSISTDFRNTNFELDVFGAEKTTNNLEFTLRLGWYF